MTTIENGRNLLPQSTFLPSLDGKKVVNYAQWQSKAEFEAMQKDPRAISHMKAAPELAKFEPILCEVAEGPSKRGDRPCPGLEERERELRRGRPSQTKKSRRKTTATDEQSARDPPKRRTSCIA